MKDDIDIPLKHTSPSDFLDNVLTEPFSESSCTLMRMTLPDNAQAFCPSGTVSDVAPLTDERSKMLSANIDPVACGRVSLT